MKEITLGIKAGIKWTFTETLDDLDCADDIALLSHNCGDIQSNSENLARNTGTAKQQSNSRPHNDWRTYH